MHQATVIVVTPEAAVISFGDKEPVDIAVGSEGRRLASASVDFDIRPMVHNRARRGPHQHRQRRSADFIVIGLHHQLPVGS